MEEEIDDAAASFYQPRKYSNLINEEDMPTFGE